MQIIEKTIKELKAYENNPRKNDGAVEYVANSIKEFGFKVPIVIDKDDVIVCGHTRLKAAKKLGLKAVPCIVADDLTEEQVKAFRLADNKTAEIAEWDLELLGEELGGILDIDMSDFGFDDLLKDDEENKEIIEDEVPETAESIVKPGDIWQLGKHRLMCGDSTDAECVALLMDGQKADLIFTDPPYGMKKEAEGILNDNLNFEELLEFNKRWIALTFDNLNEVGSWYCWGTDEPLMDIYGAILKPLIKNNKITFRNLITWDKKIGQGQNNDEIRMFAIVDEKCLFVMKGVQGFNTNADHYFEAWEPIRNYLLQSRLAMGWDVPTMKKIAGHSDHSRDHWTSKSQWSFPTREVYNKLKEAAEKQRKQEGENNDAFKREYDDIKREYDDIKREYDDIKREYYATRAYFNNTHDIMNNVWHFDRTSAEERATAGGHATPKPIALCSRAIKTSSREGELVLDVFGGSGSTLIACEQLGRVCYCMELEPRYCDIIIKRWEILTGQKAEQIRG